MDGSRAFACYRKIDDEMKKELVNLLDLHLMKDKENKEKFEVFKAGILKWKNEYRTLMPERKQPHCRKRQRRMCNI